MGKLCKLGIPHNERRFEYLEDFSWDCDWYWGGGYVGNNSIHHHFESLLGFNVNKNMYDQFIEYYEYTNLTDDQIWRLCDLMKQFYSYKSSAECFQYGGHYTSKGRTDAEINKDMAKQLNSHIENVIIPEVRNLVKDVDSQEMRKL